MILDTLYIKSSCGKRISAQAAPAIRSIRLPAVVGMLLLSGLRVGVVLYLFVFGFNIPLQRRGDSMVGRYLPGFFDIRFHL